MKELTKTEATELKEYNGNKCITSLKVAEITGKNHSHVIKDIRIMLGELDKTEGTFTLKYKPENIKRAFIVFYLPEREFNILITGYSTILRAKLYDEWKSLKEEQTPQNRYKEIERKNPLYESSKIEKSNNKLNAIMQMMDVIKTNQAQSQQLISMIQDMDEPKPIETVIIGENAKLSDLIGKGAIKSTLRLLGN